MSLIAADSRVIPRPVDSDKSHIEIKCSSILR